MNEGYDPYNHTGRLVRRGEWQPLATDWWGILDERLSGDGLERERDEWAYRRAKGTPAETG